MYDPQLVKRLCISIALEKDLAESERLMNLLHAVMQEDTEEVRLRLKLLKKLYDPILGVVADETIVKPEAPSSAALHKLCVDGDS